MNGTPLISIVIPTKDRAALLKQTLDSVRAQTYDNWEAIVVDDHSSDSTVEDTRAAAAGEARIRLISLKNESGAPAGRNHGSEAARGEFVIFLDSDDTLAPHCLAQRAEFIAARPDLDFAVFPCQLFRQTPGDVELLWNRKTEENDLDRMLKMDVLWQTTGPIWRRASLAKVAPWDEEVLAGQDWEWHIRAIVAGLKYEWIEGDGRPDCFWRLADSERDSIGKQSFSPKYFRARPAVIAKMQRVIESANLMTSQRKEFFAGMYFQAAERLANRVSRKEGRHAWREALHAGVITPSQHRQGQNYLWAFRWPSLREKRRRTLETIWPDTFFIRRSGTYLKTPLVRGDLPAISVVMSVYNGERYLRECIDSIVAQTFGDWEFIIIDDGSRDATLSILRHYEARDKRFRIISRANKGLTPSLNEGLAAARAEWIARMDADDVALPRRFELEIAYLRKHSDVVLLGTRTELVDPYGLHIGDTEQPLDHESIDRELMAGRGGTICHPAAMYRRQLALDLGGYRAQCGHNEDLDLWLRMAERGRVANLPDILLKYRQHLESIVRTRFEQQMKVKRGVIEDAYVRRGLEFPKDWSFAPKPPKHGPAQLLEWAWAALKRKQLVAARGHAKQLVKHAPLSLMSWKTLYCAWRGH